VNTPRHPDRSRDSLDTQWDRLYPSDPELMASTEGDRKGLAELQRVARENLAETERA
jgi:hypothetical protein